MMRMLLQISELFTCARVGGLPMLTASGSNGLVIRKVVRLVAKRR